MMNAIQKNTRLKPVNRHAMWQYLLMMVVLITMTISALPNLFPKQQIITLSPVSGSQVSAAEVHQWLTEKNLNINTIQHQDNKMNIVLAAPGQNTIALAILDEKLEAGLTPKLTEQDSTPLWLTQLGAEPMKLGLDLSGGVLFVLDVDVKEAQSIRFQQTKDAIKTAIRKLKLRGAKVSLTDDNIISIRYPASPKKSLLKTQLKKQFPGMTIQESKNLPLKLFWTEEQQLQFQTQVIEQTLKTMRNRIEELGITEATVQRQGSHRIRIELPGVKDPTQARAIIGATASLDFYQMQTAGGKSFFTEQGEIINVSSSPVFTGDHIQNAIAGRDEMGMPLVNLTLDSLGGKKMSDFSAKNIGKPMVTVFSEYYKNEQGETVKNSKVINIATIQTALSSRFSITNMSSPQKANELALLLRAGSLIAPVTISREQTINATLGENNIANGFSALILGVSLTLAFMVLWYKKLGIIANAALLFNLICLLGLMSLIPGAVLTLPGIAGLVLTIGMAVDTNVLIFERIKDERRRGRSLALAIDQGYKNAFATIFDANITTLITALILYSIGYGPVKGFAITLGLGILCSMFTGIFVSRGLTNLAYKNTSGKPHSKEIAA